MRCFTFSLGLLVLAAPAEAALSGWHDSGAKISAILSDSATADLHGQMHLRRVENTATTKAGDDIWEVESQHCVMSVTLRAIPPAGPGATRYEVRDRSACR